MIKTFIRLKIPGSMALAASTLLAQSGSSNTNSLPLKQTVRCQLALEQDRSLGERSLLPPGLQEKLRLADEQRVELKPIEDDFAETSKQYQAANQPRVDAAREADRQARQAQDAGQIQAARTQLQNVWAGLQPCRDSAVLKIKPLLTPDQLAILEAPANQWRESHGSEANDPSSN